MKNKLISLMAFCAMGAMAAQDTAFSIRQVRDPVQLKAKLEANAQDAETRLVAAGSVATSAIILTNSSNGGTASILANVDANGDAGDSNKLLVPDNGGFHFQSDSASKGTLANILAFGNTGIVTLLGGGTIDNSTSATVMNLTEDNVKVTGAFQVTGATTLATSLTGVVKASSGVVSAATLVDADVSASAAIAQTKIATNTLGAITLVVLSTDGKTNTLSFTAQGILSGNVITP